MPTEFIKRTTNLFFWYSNSNIIKKSIIEMLLIEMSHVIIEYCEKKNILNFYKYIIM